MMIVHGLGIAATTSSTSPLISEISSPTLFGSALGALETIKDVGHATGPILAGFLIGQLGYVPAFVITSTILLADLTIFRLHLRKDEGRIITA
jgi:MFS family permease